MHTANGKYWRLRCIEYRGEEVARDDAKIYFDAKCDAEVLSHSIFDVHFLFPSPFLGPPRISEDSQSVTQLLMENGIYFRRM